MEHCNMAYVSNMATNHFKNSLPWQYEIKQCLKKKTVSLLSPQKYFNNWLFMWFNQQITD